MAHLKTGMWDLPKWKIQKCKKDIMIKACSKNVKNFRTVFLSKKKKISVKKVNSMFLCPSQLFPVLQWDPDINMDQFIRTWTILVKRSASLNQIFQHLLLQCKTHQHWISSSQL